MAWQKMSEMSYQDNAYTKNTAVLAEKKHRTKHSSPIGKLFPGLAGKACNVAVRS